jgi:hypothetical protein
VFNGSDLGKAFSANQLSEQLLPDPVKNTARYAQSELPGNGSNLSPTNDEFMEALFAAERQDLAALNKFKIKKRKGQKL